MHIKCQFTESYNKKKILHFLFSTFYLSTISFCRLIRKIMYYTSQTQESVWHGMILSTIWVPLPGLVQVSSWLSSGRHHLKLRCRIWLDSLEWVSTHLSWVSFFLFVDNIFRRFLQDIVLFLVFFCLALHMVLSFLGFSCWPSDCDL